MLEAGRNPVIARIREAVPEFEDSFQEALRDEDGELGPFQAMSLFAQWVVERVHRTGPDEVTRRAFQAVEELSADRRLDDEVVTEFIEALWNDSDATQLMGTKTRERALGGA